MPPISIRVVRVIRWLPWNSVRCAQGGNQFARRSFLALRSGWTTSARLVESPFHQGGAVAARQVFSNFHPSPPVPGHGHAQACLRFPAGTRSLISARSPDAHPSAPVTCKVVPLLHSQSMPALAVFFPGASGPRRAPLLFQAFASGAWASARDVRGPLCRSRSSGHRRHLSAFGGYR